MQVEIYADVIFFINFIMDFFVFYLVSKIVKRETSFFRIIIASFCASIMYCLMIFLKPLRDGINFFMAIVIIMVSVLVCFKPNNIKDFFKLIFLTNFVAFAVGGVGMAVFYYTNIGNLIGNMIEINNSRFSIKVLLSATCISYIAIKIGINTYKRAMIKRQLLLGVKIYKGDNSFLLNALVDTGNSLHEPISNEPVIVAEFNAVKDILPEKIRLMYYENKENNLQEIIKAVQDEGNGFRLIPFSSLGKKNGMLIGFRVDKAEIEADKRITINNAIIGIYNLTLSCDGGYNALINPESLEVKEVSQ